jgi:hypothetical protein
MNHEEMDKLIREMSDLLVKLDGTLWPPAEWINEMSLDYQQFGNLFKRLFKEL